MAVIVDLSPLSCRVNVIICKYDNITTMTTMSCVSQFSVFGIYTSLWPIFISVDTGQLSAVETPAAFRFQRISVLWTSLGKKHFAWCFYFKSDVLVSYQKPFFRIISEAFFKRVVLQRPILVYIVN